MMNFLAAAIDRHVKDQGRIQIEWDGQEWEVRVYWKVRQQGALVEWDSEPVRCKHFEDAMRAVLRKRRRVFLGS